ncbi:DAK2 domain-containing protein [Cellulomonas uda]|uniref:Dihydroxyacetone kinase n=1 Tax=Cellulomonas uda TaxID=1714 RepID=A0A4Y3K9T6_CELUD|nr:DAK2 domain-containing protein [Cellulomonas uda]NII65352.1 hypothetical protein [Cellulomonas uda]GEA79748.1 dihydroxyacetone kinase [Cellulomonas uda]
MLLGTDQALAWVSAARAGLVGARGRIDAVNVFPVADADTGTNAWLTVEGGARAVDELLASPGGPPDAEAALAAFARGAMLAARGNSGVILSQWLAGFVRRARRDDDGPARVLADALRDAARAARLALADPQEGTVLTLADEVAEAAELAADAGAPTGQAVAHAAAAGHQALARISATHPVLRRAHVPDAGACALLVVVDALVAAVTREPARDPALWLPERSVPRARDADGDLPDAGHGGGGAFEVMLVVQAPRADLGDHLREGLAAVGDSVAVVGADGWWHAHVHTDEPVAAIDACAAGAREQVVVRRLDVVDAAVGPRPDGWGLVVVTASPGLAAWYATAGAVVVVRCPELPVRAEHVRRAVEDARDESGRAVLVVPGGAVAGDELDLLLGIDGVEVLGADDEARAAVATLAFVTAGTSAAAAAALATARARVAALEPDASVAELGRTVDGLVRAVPDRLADLPDRLAGALTDGALPVPESLTVVVPGPLDELLAAQVERVAAQHGLEPTVLADASATRVLVAVD